MRLREVFRYEVEYRLRSASTWIYAGILWVLPLWIMLVEYDSAATIHFNAPVRLVDGALIVGVFGILVSAALFGDAALRDVEAGMDQLLYASPLGKTEYLGGRFLAALAVNAILLLGIPLGMLAAAQMPFLDPEQVGPFRAGAYLQPFLLFSLPNLVLIGAILFTIAALARHTIPVYLGAIGFLIGYVVAANYIGRIESPALAVLADPIGIGTLERMTRYWTPAEQNTRLFLSGMLVWNRVVWLAVAAAVLALLHRTFRFAHDDGGGRRKERRTVAVPGSERAAPVMVPRVQRAFGLRTRVRQTLAVARNSLEAIAASRSFAGTLLVAMGLALFWGWNVGSTVFDTSTWPVTHLVAGVALTERVSPIIGLLIAIWAGGLVWKERDVGAAEIADASPVPEGVALLGRFLALVAMLAALQAAFMAAGILLQALQGYHHFELGLYLKILFGINLVHWALIGALAMTIHVIVNQKHLGHIVVVMAWAFTMIAREFGIRHHLLAYGTDPGWIYSEMNGFGPYIGPFVWFNLYWAAWALLLAVMASLLWVRGREGGLRHRLREARVRFAGSVARTAGVAVALILVLGGFIFFNTNVLNDYRTADEAGLPQAEYEKRYGRFEGAPQPTIESVSLRVEIWPEERAADLRGTYRLVNRTEAAIDSVHVLLLDPDIQARSISFDRPSEPVVVDDETGYRIYALRQSLAPADSLELAFDLSYRPRGFPNSGIPTDVVGNGTYINRTLLPAIGYQPALELSGDEARRRFGLEPQPPSPTPDDAEARQWRWTVRNEDLVDIDAVVGTAADQIAVTLGVLRRSWTENGRRYFHYQSEVPIPFGTVFSAEYAVLEDRWKDVALRIFHDPAHTAVLDRMMRGMKASLEYHTEVFGPYPYSQLRIAEVPPYSIFGRAHPGTIAFSEHAFLSRVEEGQLDQPFYGTAHEVAHHWWGGQVRGAAVRGQAFLTESLANYGAMMVTEKTYGTEAARRVYDFYMERYLRGRAEQSREVPVLEVEDQPYIAYRKGAMALYTLRDRIGEEAVNTALRRYFERYRDAGPPYPTSLDLYAELRAVTPDSLHTLLVDLFETITLWDVRAERARVEPTGTGEFRVTLEVVAKKMRADSVGNETDVPMDDLVEIGVFAPGEGSGAELGEPLYLKRHRIRSGEQTITVIVPREPARAGIDPWHKLIDRHRDDNVVAVEAAGADPVGTTP